MEEIIIKLKKIIKRLEHFHNKMEIDSEITHAQFRIIFPIIKSGEGKTMQELALFVGVDKSLVSRTITDLESKGFVERDKEEGSAMRNYKIILSEKGKQFFAKKHLQAKEMSKDFFEGLTMKELQTTKKVIDKLADYKETE